jgi:hypothetical protein
MAAVEKETEERKEELKVEQALKGEIDEKWAVSAEQQKRKKKEQAESAVAMEEELKLRLESVEHATDEMRHTLHTAEEERAHTEEREQHSLHQIAERNEHQQIELRRGEHRLQQLKHELEENNVVNDAKVDELKLMLMKRQKVAHQEVQQLVSFRQDLEIKLQKYAMFSKMKKNIGVCARCGETFLHSENYNWACRYHSSTFVDGTIYFCCGATNKFDKGCISAKHTELSAIDTDLKTNEGRLAAVVKRPRELPCTTCGSPDHTEDVCPVDPNVRSLALQRGQNELQRLEAYGHGSTKTRQEIDNGKHQLVGEILTKESLFTLEEEDADEPESSFLRLCDEKDWQRHHSEDGGHLNNAVMDRHDRLMFDTETQIEDALAADVEADLSEAVKIGRKRKVDIGLIKKAEKQLKRNAAGQKLEETYARVESLTATLRLYAEPSTIEQYIGYLKEAVAEATKADADVDMLESAQEKLAELQSRLDLTIAMRQKRVDPITKAMARAKIYNVDQHVLDEAEAERVQLMAVEQVDLASLQEQRTEGTDMNTVIMVFTESMVERLREALEEAVESGVREDELESARRVLPTPATHAISTVLKAGESVCHTSC